MKTMELLSDHHGIVVKKSINLYDVLIDDRILTCEVANHLRKELIYPTAAPSSLPPVVQKVHWKEHSELLAVGDLVQIEAGVITGVLPRISCLVRRTAVPMPGAHPFEQVIAANIDQVLPVFAAAKPALKWNLLDRYLVSAESLGLPSLICINKLDLAQNAAGELEPELAEGIRVYRQIGYPVILTSTVTGEGLQELRGYLKDRISVFVGKSGVGKTSLLNVLQPGLGLKVNGVSQATGKGKHTTTSAELFRLDNGGALVDTPGMREFGLWNVEANDLAACFPEMRPYLSACRFSSNCRHKDEPGCAIRKAVMEGQIHPRRYKNYLQLLQEGYFHG